MNDVEIPAATEGSYRGLHVVALATDNLDLYWAIRTFGVCSRNLVRIKFLVGRISLERSALYLASESPLKIPHSNVPFYTVRADLPKAADHGVPGALGHAQAFRRV